MEYSYIKNGRLNAQDKKRLRTIFQVLSHMQHNRPNRNLPQMASRIYNYILDTNSRPIPGVLDWLLSYGTPQFLKKIKDTIDYVGPDQWKLDAVKNVGSELFLKKEYATPDFQMVKTSNQPKSALICFTGNAHRLFMPLQCFNALVVNHFDMLIYLRDIKKNFYTNGIPQLGNNLPDLTEAIKKYLPSDCWISVIGASSGGYAATRFSELVHADRLAVFSPAAEFKGNITVCDSPYSVKDIQFFFAKNNSLDDFSLNYWDKTAYSDYIQLLDTPNHDTLPFLIEKNYFNDFVGWLKGERDKFDL